MTVLYVIVSILRFVLRVILLPVQAILTLLLLSLGFISGLTELVFGILGAICFFGGLFELLSSTGSTALGWQGIIGGILFVVIPQALALWGEMGIVPDLMSCHAAALFVCR